MRVGTGMALVLAAGVVWSFQGLILRQISEAGTWAVLAWRSMGMLPVILGFLVWRAKGSPVPAIRRAGLAGVLGGVGLIAAFGGAIHAIQSTTIANAVFLFAASPFLAALLGRLVLGEHVAPRTWIAIAVAMSGVALMVRDGLSGGAMEGNLAALASAFGFAAFTVALRWRRVEDTLPAVLWGAVFSILAGVVMARATGQPLAVPVTEAAWAFGMGALTLSGGMVLYTLGSRVVPAAELTLLSLTEVLLAPVWVWLLLGETASAATFVGGAIVLGAVVGNGLIGARRATAASPAPHGPPRTTP